MQEFFDELGERLEDLEDLVELRAAKELEHIAQTVPLSEVERQFEDAG